MTFQFSAEQMDIINHFDGNLQIIASAGSGKTETIARRCAMLLKKGIKPEQIIAFTFTDKAAEELRSRIERHTADIMGYDFLGKTNQMYIGTIHAFCLSFLRHNIPKYELYDMVNEHRLVSLIDKEFDTLELQELGQFPRWKTIRLFIDNMSVIENEGLDENSLDDTPFKKCYLKLLNILKDYKLLTFGQSIVLTARALDDQDIKIRSLSSLRHIIVDEYQDINPIQSKLIKSLSQIGSVSINVVGDDLQSIYQWRGANVENIINFSKDFQNVNQKTLTINRRSRPTIIYIAEKFAQKISPRLPKVMKSSRSSGDLELVLGLRPQSVSSRAYPHRIPWLFPSS
jgi:DNA helicase II / ATP-dependent DNA helicase PcrA